MPLNNLSLKSKLIMMLLAVAIGCIVIIGYQGLSNGEKALKARINEQLISVRESKSFQVESWYRGLSNQVKLLASNHATIFAMRDFKDAFRRLAADKAALPESGRQALEAFYTDQFFPKLEASTKEKPLLDVYLPQPLVSQKLQATYIASNPNPLGKKNLLADAKPRSYYANTHRHYHPLFNQVLTENDFYDVFLIDIDSGDIIYSVYKEVDYATSLKTGPYRNSNLGQLYQKIVRTQGYRKVTSVDFDFYKPSYGKPSMFMGSTIFDLDYRPTGILIVQVPISQLDSIMVGEGWEGQGLGKTGEAYLVGEDGLMRSESRLHITKSPDSADTESCYAKQLQEKRMLDAQTAEKICDLNTSILLQPMEGSYIDKALKGESGSGNVTSYSGQDALVSYKPLFLDNMKWVLAAKIDESEAYEPIHQFQKELGISAIIIASVVTFLAMLLSTLFLRPLHFLIQEVRNLSNGSNDLHVDIQRGDEYGELAEAMNMAGTVIKQQGQDIAAKESYSQSLLHSILPEKAARQFSAGNQNFAERIESASVLHIDIRGFSHYAEKDNPEVAIGLFNRLIGAIDALADEYLMDRIKTVGENYLVACGLSVSRLDHAKRSVDFACSALQMLRKFNQTQGTQFTMRIGIHCGAVLAGVVGEKRFSYDLWGNTVDIADRIRYEADADSVIVTEDVHNCLDGSRTFTERPVLRTRALGDLRLWVYSVEKPEQSAVSVATEDNPQLESVD